MRALEKYWSVLDADDDDLTTAGVIREFEAAGLVVSMPHVHRWTEPPQWVHSAAATIQFCIDCHGLHWVPVEVGG